MGLLLHCRDKLVGNCDGEGVPVHPMKAYRRRRGIAPLILNLGAGWRRVVALPPEKNIVPIP